MRGDDDARMAPERMRRRQRLLAEHVEHRRRKLARIERRQQVGFDQMPAAPGIDDRRAARQPGERARHRGCPRSPGSAAAATPGSRCGRGSRRARRRRHRWRSPAPSFADRLQPATSNPSACSLRPASWPSVPKPRMPTRALGGVLLLALAPLAGALLRRGNRGPGGAGAAPGARRTRSSRRSCRGRPGARSAGAAGRSGRRECRRPRRRGRRSA